ncbi:unnamed protein product, partial [Symbiodinium microadriaticum]
MASFKICQQLLPPKKKPAVLYAMCGLLQAMQQRPTARWTGTTSARQRPAVLRAVGRFQWTVLSAGQPRHVGAVDAAHREPVLQQEWQAYQSKFDAAQGPQEILKGCARVPQSNHLDMAKESPVPVLPGAIARDFSGQLGSEVSEPPYSLPKSSRSKTSESYPSKRNAAESANADKLCASVISKGKEVQFSLDVVPDGKLRKSDDLPSASPLLVRWRQKVRIVA